MVHSHNKSSRVSYLPEIDGLRALAVLAVMIFHMRGSWLPGGFTGVDVFFVISGYVVSKSIAERDGRGFWSGLAEFYARRLVRILPALVVCLVVVAFLSMLFVPASWLSSTAEKTGLAAFFGLSNFALVMLNDGYFSPRIEFNPFVHTWSLAVEEQFYLIFPLPFFLWLAWRKLPGWRCGLAWLVLPALAVISFGVAYAWGRTSSDWAYYLLPARFWELAAGSLLYQWQSHAARSAAPDAGRAGLLLWPGLALIAAGFWWAEPARFPYPWALLPVLGTLCLLQAVASPVPQAGWGHRWLRHPAMRYVGRISYSLYLWHWPVYALMRWTVGLQSPATMAAALAVTFVCAMLSYHWVERPILVAGPIRRQPRWARILGGLALAGMGYFMTSYGYQHREAISLSVTANTRDWYAYPLPVTDIDPAGRVFEGRNLFVIGNSHAGAYHTMLNEAEQRLGFRLHLFQTGACPMGHLLYPIGSDAPCLKLVEDLMNYIQTHGKPGDIVFFASLRTHRLADQWAQFDREAVLAHARSDAAEQARLQALEENSIIIRRLDEQGLLVLIDAPKPVFPVPPFRCSDPFNRHNPVCAGGAEIERDTLLNMRLPIMRSLTTLDERFGNVYLWDPFPILCPAEQLRCSPFDADGRPLFFDGDHLGGWGNLTLYPAFAAELARIWEPTQP